ncbi:hypothetical protein Back11_58520 [Paenibacillus baekrokdamisoli]|uniref:PPM-type phosphatase domain-containing protein n=1 Tax=Paenibacillus baekrokdamisoli TaxID=1712516 RepID=A0A3G9IZY2_9BACL|nr:protein phosphatase 2C domain-containing protein [Paenibacillus baekrokdamisoli]MBB3071462.1 serine/threonine protein phosphatase PrpC [Paenibacillus baekrokdamisoli]BBH24507.1 hypothetical protein Back11_58520 [Paenibacillus baekrokdamisoli]
MRITTVLVQGNGILNEDALIRNEAIQLYGVIDGATSLVPYKNANGETGGYLAAHLIATCLNELKEQDRTGGAEGLVDRLAEVNLLLRTRMIEAGIRPEQKEELWSACAAVVQIQPEWIEFAQAGDCMIAVFYTDGRIRVITHDQLAHVDDRTKEVWSQGIASGLSSKAELWEYVKPQIIRGRALANAPGGYAVLNGESKFADYAEYGRISRTNVQALLLFSDGLYIPKPAGVSDKDGASEVAALVQEKGLSSYIEWLAALEMSDPDCRQFPRMKTSDDKSAIWIDLPLVTSHD